uniref:ST6 N-acetylgalactosaminide alpha-2,6-sialyltransferase 5 n=1 Tax=Cyanistes caeruleus TaxID=156563 RepID=A0A8C0V648_CYACU
GAAVSALQPRGWQRLLCGALAATCAQLRVSGSVARRSFPGRAEVRGRGPGRACPHKPCPLGPAGPGHCPPCGAPSAPRVSLHKALSARFLTPADLVLLRTLCKKKRNKQITPTPKNPQFILQQNLGTDLCTFQQFRRRRRKISNTWLSTGWFTMTIALELCDRINVYGMVPPDFCRDPNHLSVPYHYYEPLGPDECTMYISHERGRKGSHHRFITEKRVFENWARTFDIHFFQPDWKPEPLTVTHPEVKPLA